ncbi:SecY-interacting protein [Shewanella sp. 4_MG-2023]|uniref:SecY-interacting protein n=1 Tax=Shewanella sp. 4_MG-2023 TaxID=3062652 RepID=UPI0026E1433D|nr:SecY-interacting protein [Shewanella sp. 4_MG-2023]MDO6678383.1 SecY-interacting protein [Shewanella sp. 4_MG-2023]
MSCSTSLDQFSNRYIQAYQDTLGELPRFYPMGQGSSCIEGQYDLESDEAVFWQTVKRKSTADFSNVEHALELKLHDDINDFYGHFFSASLYFDSNWGEGELLQVWNQQDFESLQQNIIGHLMMKKKLKQAPTWFIGVLGDGDNMLTVDNEDGSVWIEVPGNKPHEKLADSLAGFIDSLTPRVTPAIEPVEEDHGHVPHPGIWQRMKMMWNDLLKRKS